MRLSARKTYKIIRKNLPNSWQANLTKLVFRLSGKPFVKNDTISLESKFPRKERGGLILSADFELAWAARYSKSSNTPLHTALVKAKQARENFSLLLPLFEKYNIPVTWATVGHLFLSECSKASHEWMQRIPYFENKCWRFSAGDWFDFDPYTNVQDAPEWYAPDLIQKLVESNVEHEMATHTFSHVDFSDRYCPPAVADDEIKACVQAMGKWNLKPLSICFPAGTWGNISVLKKYGIKIYRRKIHGLNLTYPYFDEYGLLVTLTSDAFDRLYPSWSAEYYFHRFKKSIDKAVQTGTIAHFLFHPSMDPWMISEVMGNVLSYASRLRDQGWLWIGTMKEIAEFISRDENGIKDEL